MPPAYCGSGTFTATRPPWSARSRALKTTDIPPRPISSRMRNRPSTVWPGATRSGGAMGTTRVASPRVLSGPPLKMSSRSRAARRALLNRHVLHVLDDPLRDVIPRRPTGLERLERAAVPQRLGRRRVLLGEPYRREAGVPRQVPARIHRHPGEPELRRG